MELLPSLVRLAVDLVQTQELAVEPDHSAAGLRSTKLLRETAALELLSVQREAATD